MARATRSSVQTVEKDNDDGTENKSASTAVAATTTTTTAASNKANKKRKRMSMAVDFEDQPASKQPKGVKEEEQEDPSQELPSSDQNEIEIKLQGIKGAGQSPINPEDAQKILDILEMIDTQGLLDRVFPLPSESEPPVPGIEAQDGHPPPSASFRTLLTESSQHPLHVLRAAIRHLLPVFAQPRSRPSTPAAQQLRFCHLALSLLEQASHHSINNPPDLDTFLSTASNTSSDLALKPDPSKPKSWRRRKYALVQHLPTGDWWTSLNADFPPPPSSSFSSSSSPHPTVAQALNNDRALTDLPTANAELVAIFPSPSDDVPEKVPTLGAAMSLPTKSSASGSGGAAAFRRRGPRQLTVGKYLDYGPFASFAPTFDQEAKELGQWEVNEVLCARMRRRRIRDEWKRAWQVEGLVEDRASAAIAIEEANREQSVPARVDAESGDLNDVTGVSDEDKGGEDYNTAVELDTKGALEGLLPADQVAVLQSALDRLELEDGVQQLLDKTANALNLLQQLQFERISAPDGASSTADPDSEEWQIASDVLDSLILLTSLRPRVSGSESSAPPPLVPTSSTLHRLHQTLPVKPSKGWYGSLPPGNPIALRDDSTLRVKPGAVIPQSNVAATTVSSTTTASNQVTPSVASTNTAAPAVTTAAGYAAYPYGAYNPATYQSLYAAAGYKAPPAGAYPAGAYNPSQYYAQYTAAAAARQQQGQQQPSTTPGGGNTAASTPTTTTAPAPPQWYAYTPAQVQAAAAAAAAGMLAGNPAVRTNGVANNGNAGGGSASGRGTPQPQQQQQQPVPYYIPQPVQRPPSTTPGATGAGVPTTPRAVGNLAVPATYGPGSEWDRRASAAGGGYVPPPTPTLPLHLRASGSSQPGTPVPAGSPQAAQASR